MLATGLIISRREELEVDLIEPARERDVAMKYAIVIERAGSNYSAYAPDLPGCVATGASIDETKQRMAEAIAMHIEGMRDDGVVPPVPTVVCDYVAVSA